MIILLSSVPPEDHDVLHSTMNFQRFKKQFLQQFHCYVKEVTLDLYQGNLNCEIS